MIKSPDKSGDLSLRTFVLRQLSSRRDRIATGRLTRPALLMRFSKKPRSR
ncbi:MAG: hypothetical protein NTW93_06630 [Phycisphaerae bacterium]|nr:hypothetical protein [Phycisphaerae bacterium]